MQWGISFPKGRADRTAARLALCNACEHRILGPMGIAKCELCGCPIQSKVRLSANGACPVGKW